MNIHDLAMMTAYYRDDDRVERVDGGYLVRSEDFDGWRLALLDGDVYWRGYTRAGEVVAGPFDTADEVIHVLIGDPR